MHAALFVKILWWKIKVAKSKIKTINVINLMNIINIININNIINIINIINNSNGEVGPAKNWKRRTEATGCTYTSAFSSQGHCGGKTKEKIQRRNERRIKTKTKE